MDRREFLAGGSALLLNDSLRAQASRPEQHRDIITAAYYFGNFHVDPRNEDAHGKGWTEWNLVRAARPRFQGHHQPRVPLWGYADESSPVTFQEKIHAARQSGVNAFIFDWYWYEDGPFLNRALEGGYLNASNNRDVSFALMWANHDWIDLHPAKLDTPGKVQFRGGVSRREFDAMCERVLELFHHPSYLKLEGRPYFSVYELNRFIDGLGGVPQAAAALDDFQKKAQRNGFPGVHFNAITWGVKLLPGESTVTTLPELLRSLGIDSTTSYVWIHHVPLSGDLTTEYLDVRAKYEAYRDRASDVLGRVYFPNVTVGWDATPRTCQTDNFRVGTYPFTSVVVGNIAEAFEDALKSAREYALEHLPKGRRMITLNSWNEWTEGSYLEPDTKHGNVYLDAVRKIFGT